MALWYAKSPDCTMTVDIFLQIAARNSHVGVDDEASERLVGNLSVLEDGFAADDGVMHDALKLPSHVRCHLRVLVEDRALVHGQRFQRIPNDEVCIVADLISTRK